MTTSIDSAMGTAKEAIGSAKHVAKDMADDAAEAMKDKADVAAKTAKQVVSFLSDIDLDDVLGLVGLRRKRSAMGTIAILGGGILLGAGLALLISPVSGRDTRQQIRKLFESLGTRAKDEVQEVKQQANKLAGEVKEKAGEVAGEVKEKVGMAQEKAGEVVDQARETVEGATEEGGKGRRRHNQNAQVS